MRTDGLHLSAEAVAAIRQHIGARFGANYLPAQPAVYATKVKNAQEAHEAIRPTKASREPGAVHASRLLPAVGRWSWKATDAQGAHEAIRPTRGLRARCGALFVSIKHKHLRMLMCYVESSSSQVLAWLWTNRDALDSMLYPL
jgi:DNA topoisomerase IA